MLLTGANPVHYNSVMTSAPGRPPDVGTPRDEKVEVRVTRDEKLKLMKLAKERGVTTSAYVRTVIFNPVLDNEYWPDEKDQEAKD